MRKNKVFSLWDSLIRNAGYLLGLNLVGAIGGVFFWALASRLYSPEEVGLASATISIMVLLSGLSSFGLGMGIVRFLGKTQDSQQMLNTVSTFILLTSLVIGSLFLLGLRLWSPSLMYLRQNPFVIIGFVGLLIMSGQSSIYQFTYQAFRESKYAFWHFFIVHVVRIIFIIPIVSIGALSIVGAVAIGTTVANGLSLFVFIPHIIDGYKFRLIKTVQTVKRLAPYSFGSYLADLMYRVPILIVPPLVLEMVDAQSSAHAYIAWMLGWLLTSPGQALAASVFAEGSHSPGDIDHLLSKSAWYGIVFTVFSAIVVGSNARLILSLFGKSYAMETVSLLRWLILAAPLVVFNSLFFSVLRVQMRIRVLIILTALSATLTLIVSYFGFRKFGLSATGIGWLIGQATVALFVAGYYLPKGNTKEAVSKITDKVTVEIMPRE